ncbi:MAG: hypothetical protein WC707_01180 [Candidatus Babeliaceae bacterium]|jgi:hypothetical protein
MPQQFFKNLTLLALFFPAFIHGMEVEKGAQPQDYFVTPYQKKFSDILSIVQSLQKSQESVLFYKPNQKISNIGIGKKYAEKLALSNLALSKVALSADLIDASNISPLALYMNQEESSRNIDLSNNTLCTRSQLLLMNNYWESYKTNTIPTKLDAKSLKRVGLLANFLGNKKLENFVAKRIADFVSKPEILKKNPDQGIRLIQAFPPEIYYYFNKRIAETLYDKHFDLLAPSLQKALSQQSPKQICKIKTDHDYGFISNIRITPDDNKMVFSNPISKEITIFDTTTKKSTSLEETDGIAIITPDGQKIITTNGTNIHIRDIDGHIINTITQDTTEGQYAIITSITTTPNGKKIIFALSDHQNCGSLNACIGVADIETQKIVKKHYPEHSQIYNIISTSDGTNFFYSCSDGIVIHDMSNNTYKIISEEKSDAIISHNNTITTQHELTDKTNMINTFDEQGALIQSTTRYNADYIFVEGVFSGPHLILPGETLSIWHPFSKKSFTFARNIYWNAYHALAVTSDGKRLIVSKAIRDEGNIIEERDISVLTKYSTMAALDLYATVLTYFKKPPVD